MRTSLLLAFAATLMAGPPASAQAPSRWPTHAWRITCNPDMMLELDGNQVLTESECDPDGGGQHDLILVMTDLLEASSVWFDGLGFREPAVETYEGAYAAEITDTFIDHEGTCGGYNRFTRELFVKWDCLFSFPDDYADIDSPETMVTWTVANMGLMYAPVHELFHGIQRTYTSADNEGRKWLFEGTATAVQLAWIMKNEPELYDEMMDRLGIAYEIYGPEALSPEQIRTLQQPQPRWFDHPLHKPATDVQAYKTSAFWGWMGRHLESEDFVAYLRHLFASAATLSSETGLAEVDHALRLPQPIATEAGLTDETDGLYALFPEFIRQQAVHPAYFEAEHAPMRLRGTGRTETVERSGTVEPIAATYYPVVVESIAGKGEVLEISLANPEDPAVHLIVDDDRYDLAASSTARNVFYTYLTAPDSFFVRVVNVSEDAATSTPKPYTLTASLLHSDVTFSGGVTGSYEVEGLPAFAMHTESDPHPGACTFVLQLPSEGTKDLVLLAGYLPRPLGPGTFPIVSRTNGVNQVGIQASPACTRPGTNCAAGLPRATNYAGSLFLTSVTGGLVIGRFEASPTGDGYAANGAFAARMTNPIGGALPSDHPCLPRK